LSSVGHRDLLLNRASAAFSPRGHPDYPRPEKSL
jgi:hypothetical protein